MNYIGKKEKITQDKIKKNKKGNYGFIIAMIILLYNLLEFGLFDFTPRSQIFSQLFLPTTSIIFTLGIVLFWKKIEIKSTRLIEIILLRIFVLIIAALLLSACSMAFFSLANRVIGKQQNYEFIGEITDCSISRKKHASIKYNVTIKDINSEIEHELTFSEEAYKRKCKNKTVKWIVKKGCLGFVYKYTLN